MNDDADYISILGNTNKVYPSKIFGRGLLKLDKVYEFQTAYPYNPENMSEYISIICTKLRDKTKIFAEPVKILPDIVTEDYISSKLLGLESVPIGIDKSSLAISCWDFKNNYTTMISAF